MAELREYMNPLSKEAILKLMSLATTQDEKWILCVALTYLNDHVLNRAEFLRKDFGTMTARVIDRLNSENE